jgi:hypothetical protein
MTHSDDDHEKTRWVWPHPGDWGTVAMAGVFFAAMIWIVVFMLSSPEPVRDMFGKKPAAAESHEVTINLQGK